MLAFGSHNFQTFVNRIVFFNFTVKKLKCRTLCRVQAWRYKHSFVLLDIYLFFFFISKAQNHAGKKHNLQTLTFLTLHILKSVSALFPIHFLWYYLE